MVTEQTRPRVYDSSPVGHDVWDQGDGMCHYPECGRRLAVYGGRVQHVRGSGGRSRSGEPRTPPMPAKEARRLVRSLSAEVERLSQENEALRLAAQPWVAVHAKLDALLKRPTGIPVVTHRRIADGGVGGRRERRSA